MEDRSVEAADLAERRVNVQRVEVAGETVQGCLFLCGFLLDDSIRCALRGFMCLCRCASVRALFVAAKVSRAADKHGALVVEDFLACLGVLCDGAVDDEAGGAFVDDFDELGDGDERGGCGEGEFAQLKVLFAVEEHAGVEVGHDVVEGEGGIGVEGGDDAEGGDNLEVVVAFVDEGEVGAFCADAEI